MAEEILKQNNAVRPLSRSKVANWVAVIERGDWKVTHQGVAIDSDGNLIDGQHRLTAIVESGVSQEMVVASDADPSTFDVIDTGKTRNASDALAIAGEKDTHQLGSMLRTVFLYEYRRDNAWSGGSAHITNHQVLKTLDANPAIREYVSIGVDLAATVGMIKSAAGAASYLVARENPRKKRKLKGWFDGLAEGAASRRRTRG